MPSLELLNSQGAAVTLEMLREIAIERLFIESMRLADLGELF